MAFRAVVVAAIVALASAGMDPGYMNMMQNMMMQMQNGGHQMQNGGQMMQNGGQQQQQGGGCNPNNPAGCTIPQGVDVGEYLQQQMQQQQYETQQMAEKMKAQFENVMREVTAKKHRYAMSVMTEFTSMCACARESISIYQTMFVENAKSLNMTDVVDMSTMNTLPYQAKSAKEARELVFAGMVNSLCTSLGSFMTFATQVENLIDVYRTNGVTQPPAGK